METITFTNELGNKIDMSVTANHEEVTVFASGPHSEVEHTWTRMEAQKLRDLLIRVLEQ